MSNRLATAASPYLRMHADNPVDWQPWDDMALAHARDTDTPILLSIGYSACHWCHVMARECFEVPAIAAAMNRSFVNIKLDREERPDIDHVYQLAHQALSGRGGGWPLTAFLDPQNLSPFYIGTYFPPTPRHGLPGFPEVLQRVGAYFASHRDELRAHAEELRDWMQRVETDVPGTAPDADATNRKAMQRASARFDPEWGGTRGAPKFPRAAELEWLLDLASEPLSAREGTQDLTPQPAIRATAELSAADGSSEAEDAIRMAHRTLGMMAMRGLQDHLGGGFFRYCVDASWTIPHFEKMLYDNAQLLPLYARAACACETKDAARAGASPDVDPALQVTATTAMQGIVDWLARDMLAPSGAFYSALGADSAGEEGRFYLWTREQMQNVLPDATRAVAEHAFGLDRPANFEGKAWHLLRVAPLGNVAWQLGRADVNIEAEYATARHTLLEARERREHPARDDKRLTAWNALAISGFARTARLLDDARCADMALRALAALRESAWIDGELFANAAEPASLIPGFLDDHAFVLDALLETMQLAFDPRDLAWAIALADALREKFSDRASGGFWLSSEQHATPLARGRSWTDDSLPNGNGVAIRSLLRLGHLIGDTRYLGTAEYALRASAAALRQYPEGCPTVLRALNEFQRPRMQIVVRCPSPRREAWRTALRDALRGAGIAPGGDPVDAFVITDEPGALPGLLAARVSRGGDGTAYVCEGPSCLAPITSPDELADTLRTANPP
ncbi:MAG TPA: thioredoxin domain-containing protein [Rhodanobacteraceae bacterium]|nr:thioredoxin domain-containing protein [Rhodanobacteraceae bacterium]